MNSKPSNELTQSDLDPLAGITQCLDNQWAPSQILHRAATKRQSLSQYAAQIEAASKTEFFKALLTLRSVVINRAFLVNNKTVSRLYLGGHDDAEVFGRFLADKTIIPYLYDERELSHFKVNDIEPEVVNYWTQAEKRKTNKLRLSWDDKRNDNLNKQSIANRFGSFFSTLHQLNSTLFQNHFSSLMSEEEIKTIFIQIREFANRVFDETNKPITRLDLYKRFVCVDGCKDNELIFDLSKPLAMEIKALADLKYNLILTDVLNRYAVTSQGSPSRECLQEVKSLTEGIHEIGEKELEELMYGLARVGLDFASRSIQLVDIGAVSLRDVMTVRSDPIWELHHQIATENLPDATKKNVHEQKFFQDPLSSVKNISGSLGRVVERLSQVQMARRTLEATEKWEVRLNAFGVFEMIASEAGHAFGLPHVPPDPVSEHVLQQGLVPIVAHAVVTFQGGGLKYEIKQPVFQGAIWADSAKKIAEEVRRRLAIKDQEIAFEQESPDQQGGGLEVKDRDE